MAITWSNNVEELANVLNAPLYTSINQVINNHNDIRNAVGELLAALQDPGNTLTPQVETAIEKLRQLAAAQEADATTIRNLATPTGGYNHRAKGRRSRKKGRSVSLRSKSKPRSRTRSKSKRNSSRSK